MEGYPGDSFWPKGDVDCVEFILLMVLAFSYAGGYHMLAVGNQETVGGLGTFGDSAARGQQI